MSGSDSDNKPDYQFDDWGERMFPVQPVQYIGPRPSEQPVEPVEQHKYGCIQLHQTLVNQIVVTRHKRLFDEYWTASVFDYVGKHGPFDQVQIPKVSVAGLLALQWSHYFAHIHGKI